MVRKPSSPADLSLARPSGIPCVLRWGQLLVCGLIAAAVTGCAAQEEIRTYEVPREPNMRMLAAMLPSGKAVWFIKVAGPDPVVEQHKKAFKEFVKSLQIDLEKEPPVSWKVPAGWKEERDDRKESERKRDRIATFRLGPKESGGLELTVNLLARQGQAASAVANVNRWRGQLGLPPLTRAELDKQIEEKKGAEKVPVGKDEALIVDMVGTGPHLASGGFFTIPEAAARPRFTAPKGWEEGQRNQFSVAAFRVGKGEESAEVTVSQVGGGVMENVNRWRGQVGLPPATEEQLNKETIKVAGEKALYAEYEGVYKGMGKFNGKPVTILGVAVSHEGDDWYFKMIGPPKVVAEQRDTFKKFVGSVTFE